jgi:hypothetical protein
MQGAEERLQGLLDKQENFQAHFQEELEKGNMDRHRELLGCKISNLDNMLEQGLKELVA